MNPFNPSEKHVESQHTTAKPDKDEIGVKLRGAEKVARIPVKIIPTEDVPRKPDWIRVEIAASPEVSRIKQLLRNHLPVQRFVHPDTFTWFAEQGAEMGFKNVAAGPLVRSSYHADQQAHRQTGALSL
ncbi:hypothetical protein J7302_26000 [Pseudomonas sp. DB1]|uniref:Lipoyl synthase n=1 Tax=Metapseudomonas boanensis TaxID=2822138 RepID=A0ABS5XPE2_9GAMM|nr:hypothetical protein [Pseudomonas boanensis]MBT8769567.1 hypothetical protein [Pseudomonas boanensis]